MSISETIIPIDCGGAQSGSVSVSGIPTGTTHAELEWHFYSGATSAGATSFSLGGASFTLDQNVGTGASSEAGCGTAHLDNPLTGTQTFAWNWGSGGARDEGGRVYLKCFVGSSGVVRYVDSDYSRNVATTDPAALTLTSVSGGYVTGSGQSYSATNPDLSAAGAQTVTRNNDAYNSENLDTAYRNTVGSSTTQFSMTSSNYSSLVAVSVEEQASGTTEVTKDSDFRWSLLQLINKDSSIRWNVLASLFKDSDLRWNILAALFKDSTLQWNLLQGVTKDTDFRWNILQLVNKDSDLRWSLLQEIVKDSELRWGLLTSVVKDSTFNWNVLKEVQLDLTAQWNVLASVFSDKTLQWNLLNGIVKDLELRWDLQESVTKDLDLRWSILQLVQSDKTLQWSLLAEVFKDLELRWDSDGSSASVVKDLTLQWSIIAAVTKDLIAQWSILSEVSANVELRWQILSAVSKDLSARWNVLQAVALDSTIQWSIVGMTQKDLTLRWSIQSDTSFPDLTGEITVQLEAAGLSIDQASPIFTLH